jgi:hypothetical protein
MCTAGKSRAHYNVATGSGVSTEPGALTWLHFDNIECQQLCRLFDATEVAQMDRMIMATTREDAPYFVHASPLFPFPFLTGFFSEIFTIAFLTPLQNSKCS